MYELPPACGYPSVRITFVPFSLYLFDILCFSRPSFVPPSCHRYPSLVHQQPTIISDNSIFCNIVQPLASFLGRQSLYTRRNDTTIYTSKCPPLYTRPFDICRDISSSLLPTPCNVGSYDKGPRGGISILHDS